MVAAPPIVAMAAAAPSVLTTHHLHLSRWRARSSEGWPFLSNWKSGPKPLCPTDLARNADCPRPHCAMSQSSRNPRQVLAKGVARRMLYEESDSYVLIEPGQEEVFVNLEELQIRLKHWLENWPGKELPSDLARFEAVDDAVDYLTDSACELDLGGGRGSMQWFRVRLDNEA